MPVQRECGGGEKHGLCWVPISGYSDTALRSHAGKGHYTEIIATRNNYDLLVNHKVRRVVYATNQTTGPPLVEIRDLATGTDITITATAEVVISAGSLNTPLILQRSGIGYAPFLQQAGIPVVADLPGVGYNLQDHGGNPGGFWTRMCLNLLRTKYFALTNEVW
jgi:choline dehydrogenase